MTKKHKLQITSLLVMVFAIGTSIMFTEFLYEPHDKYLEIDQYLSKNNFQGTVLIAKGGDILFSKGYGMANEEHLIPNTTNTVFRIGSITKQFTAVAILQLQEEGILDVLDPVSKFLPDYPQGNQITLHHLLSHTAGIPEITEFSNLSEIQRHPSNPKKVMAYFKDLPLRFTPGSKYEYSNSGYIVLGAVIESVIHQPYEEYLKEHVFEPAVMKHSYFDKNQSIISNRASGYASDNNGSLVNAEFIEMSFPHAAGSLAVTAGDLLLFHKALKDGKLLSNSSLDILFTPHAQTEKKGIAYGYGFFIDAHSIGHMGEIEGFRASSYYYVDLDLNIIVLSNHESTNTALLQKEIFSILSKFACSHPFCSWRN